MAEGGSQPEPTPEPTGESIGDLVGRLIEDGRGYAEAEFEFYRAIAEYRAIRARRAIVALAIGWFLLFAAMTAVVITALVSLTQAIGAVFAGLIIGVPLAAGGYALVRYGWSGMKGLGRDEPERQAIAEAERLL